MPGEHLIWWKRLAMAALLLAACIYCVHRAGLPGENVAEPMAWLLFAAAPLGLLAALFAFPIAGWFGDMCGRLFFPADADVPPPHYRLAGIYEREGKWDLALAEYQKIVHYHPQEIDAHLGRLRIAFGGKGDALLAHHFLNASRRRLRSGTARSALESGWMEMTGKTEGQFA